MARAEFQNQLEAKSTEKGQFEGVDDTDNVDPEREYREWKQREIERKQRDRKRLEEQENEKEDIIRRQLNPDIVREEREHSQERTKHLGSFYLDEIDEKLLKRTHEEVEDLGDHSRPTRHRK